MQVQKLAFAPALALVMAASLHSSGQTPSAPAVSSVEFIGMSAPSTLDERADVYTKAKVKVTYRNGNSRTFDLAYHQLMATTEQVGGHVVGGLWDSTGAPLTDQYGQMASDAPDGNSLMEVPGLRALRPWTSRPLALVTHFEYRETPAGYPDFLADPYASQWSKYPAAMGLTRVDQDKRTGELNATDYDNISFSRAYGLWISCAASLSPWNTHLGSEEYEPDAKVRGGFGTPASGSDDTTDIDNFSLHYFGDAAAANPYRYGLVPEVRITGDGRAQVRKHYALGRIARELADVQPDRGTVYMGDDGAYTGLFMFIADTPGQLDEGTLYAARWSQTSDVNGGSANLSWIRLGHASDHEIEELVDDGITFGDIFDVSNVDPHDPSYTLVKTYNGTEWLRLKPGQDKAAAFLETRRYAALRGATTEFAKMEGVAHNAADRKAYIVISRVEKGMLASSTDPKDDIRLARNDAGAIYELSLRGFQRDTDGRGIRSAYVATRAASIPELLGGWLGGSTDAEGNRCVQDQVCGGDNLKYAEGIRTLFIGEDTSRRNNNYVWAFNLDTRKLSRILSVPMYAEATGLQAVEDLNGFAYIMGNFQHPGEQDQKGEFLGAGAITEADVLARIDQKWDHRKKAAIGYIGTVDGALPRFK